jgi:hypothetical protein
MSMLKTSLNTTLRPKTATDSNDPKDGNFSTMTQHPWHHALDRKHFFPYVNFEVRFILFFRREIMFKETLLMVDGPFLSF